MRIRKEVSSGAGVLYIGIDDKGSTVGISDSKKLLEDIPNTHSKQVRTNVRDTIGIVAEVNLIEKWGKAFLEQVRLIQHLGRERSLQLLAAASD